MGYKKIYESIVNVAQSRIQQNKNISYLDVGAGKGELIRRIQSVLSVEPQACDYHTERFKTDGVSIKKVDFNVQPLPYDNESFDLVTCSEVLEHLENFRGIIREVHRVLKPEGICIFTTPNLDKPEPKRFMKWL